MTTTHQEMAITPQRASASLRSLKLGLCIAAIAGGLFLLRENWDQVSGNWIYLLLLACPLTHFFHGHGGHSKSADKKGQ